MKECDTRQPSRKTYISLLRGAAYAVLALAALAVILAGYPESSLAYLPRLSSSPGATSPSWVTGASSRLKWSTCSDNPAIECAFLAVPINYLDLSNTRKVHLALRKFPAKCSKKDHKGSLLLNPGGPGGSGNAFVGKVAHHLSAIVQGKYDLIGWDPRGVNMTYPDFGCAASEEQTAYSDYNIMQATLPLNGRNGSFSPTDTISDAEYMLYDRSIASRRARMEGCVAAGDIEMMRSASTAFAARDMASILDALHEDKLNYWGFSYGTVLGATFAAMFPDRVGGMVLDGVADAKLWTTDWAEFTVSCMQDTQATYKALSLQCSKSPEACALGRAAVNEDSLHQESTLLERVAALSAKLATKPMSVWHSRFGSGYVDASSLQTLLSSHLYWPASWKNLVDTLAAAERGNGTLLFEATHGIFRTSRPSPPHTSPASTRQNYGASTTINVIQCVDSQPLPDRYRDRDVQISAFRELGRQSPIGESWAISHIIPRVYCDLEAYETYRGPWDEARGLQNTSLPILFVGNTLDPVTPLKNARHMAKAFGAPLLVHDGYGHTSIAHPSICTAKAIRAFFLDGQTPKKNAICDVQKSWPFKEHDFSNLSIEDSSLLRALEDLSRAFM